MVATSVLLYTLLSFGCVPYISSDKGGGGTSNSDWPMYHQNINRTGYTSDLGPIWSNTTWKYTTGDGVQSSPAVVNGVVYVGSKDGYVYALNATAGGAQIWNYITELPIISSPAVVGGVVYIGAGDFTTSAGNVYALNATTGNKMWNYTVETRIDWCAPVFVDGVVYVGGAEDGNVYALNATTGAKIWQYATGGWILSTPAVVGGILYIGSRGDLFALNATTATLTAEQRLIWKYAMTANVITSSPAVSGNGILYVGCGIWGSDRKVYALNATAETLTAEERLIWQYETGGEVTSSPAVVNGTVYIGSLDKNVYAIGSLEPVEPRLLVPDDFETIQAAINAADPGNTILVAAGIYYEHIVVNKTVSLIGEDKTTTIIDGNGIGTVINVTANNITICGFTIRNSGAMEDNGILVYQSSGNNISHNIITNNYFGVWINESSNNIFTGNTVSNNEHGIYVWISSNNVIFHNNFRDNTNQAYVTAGYTNTWNDGYPSGGNYWSNHVCDGNPSNGSQPYIIDENNTDHYPFQHPYGWSLPPPQLIAASKMPELESFFRYQEPWLGSDGAWSINISEFHPNTILWTFGDTLWGRIEDGTKVWNMTNNSVALYNLENGTIEFYDAAQKNIFKMADWLVGPEFFGPWPFAPFIQNGKIYCFPMVINLTGWWGGGDWLADIYLAEVNNPEETPENWNITYYPIDFLPVKYEPHSFLWLATDVYVEDDTYYMYGVRDGHYVVARTQENITNFDAWEFYDGENWTSTPQIVKNGPSDLSTEYSVDYLPPFDKYLLIYQRYPDSSIWGRWADTPIGPWSEPQLLYTPPELDWDPNYWAYAIKGHYPYLSQTDKEVVVSYVIRSWNEEETLSNPILYCPYFVKLTFRAPSAITDITPAKTVVGQGYKCKINVTVENQGNVYENFTVTVYYQNATYTGTIGTTTVTLAPGAKTTLTFIWDTAGVQRDRTIGYTIFANATVVPGETETGDNTFTDGTVKVVIPGNFNADNQVNVLDLGKLGVHWLAEVGDPHYDANVDINGDGKINVIELGTLGVWWLEFE